MKKIIFLSLAICVMFFSCSQEEEQEETKLANLIIQKSDWKTAVLANEIVDSQRTISHYEFDIQELNKLISNEKVTYIWFDLGLDTKNSIVFTATGVNQRDEIVGQVSSKAILVHDYQADFSVFRRVKDIELDAPSELTHILPNQDAYAYLMNVEKWYDNFEEYLMYEDQRVERFGLQKVVIKRILMTRYIHSMALFLGVNKKEKITTVLIGKDKNGNLLINKGDINTGGRAFDFTEPCPSACDMDCGGCAQWCDDPFWMCCIAQPPCDNDDN